MPTPRLATAACRNTNEVAFVNWPGATLGRSAERLHRGRGRPPRLRGLEPAGHSSAPGTWPINRAVAVFDRPGHLIAQRSANGQFRIYTPLSRMGVYGPATTLAAEDRGVHQHLAVDAPALMRLHERLVVWDRPRCQHSIVTGHELSVGLTIRLDRRRPQCHITYTAL